MQLLRLLVLVNAALAFVQPVTGFGTQSSATTRSRRPHRASVTMWHAQEDVRVVIMPYTSKRRAGPLYKLDASYVDDRGMRYASGAICATLCSMQCFAALNSALHGQHNQFESFECFVELHGLQCASSQRPADCKCMHASRIALSTTGVRGQLFAARRTSWLSALSCTEA
jgi:hypothetical protein